MPQHTLAKRYWSSLMGVPRRPILIPSKRGREGYSLWHRYWSSLLGFRLSSFPLESADTRPPNQPIHKRTDAAPTQATHPPTRPSQGVENKKWHDTTNVVWIRSSLSRENSDAIVEVAKFNDGFRAIRDGKNPEKGTLFFTPTEWEAFLLGARDSGLDIPEKHSTDQERPTQHGEAKDATGAAQAFQDLLTDLLRTLGPDHPDTLTARANLARWQGEAGDPAAAAATYTELLTDQLRILGPDHPTTLNTRRNLARWAYGSGDIVKAVELLTVLVSDQTRVLGPDHPDTQASELALRNWQDELSER